MKRIVLLLGSLTIVFFLLSCGADDNVYYPPDNPTHSSSKADEFGCDCEFYEGFGFGYELNENESDCEEMCLEMEMEMEMEM